MAVSLDEIDRLIEAGPKAEAAPDEIDRLIGTPPPEEQPGILGRLAGAVGRAFTAPTLTMPEGLESDLEVARPAALPPIPPTQADLMAAPQATKQSALPEVLTTPTPVGKPVVEGIKAGVESVGQGSRNVLEGLTRFFSVAPTPPGEFPLKHKILAARQIMDGLFNLGLAPFLAVGVGGRELLRETNPALEARQVLDPTTSAFVREMLGGSPPERTAESVAALREPMTAGEVLELATTLGIPAVAHRLPKRARPAERPVEAVRPDVPAERPEAAVAPPGIRPVEAAAPPRIEEAAPGVSGTIQRAEAATQRAREALDRMEELARRAEEVPALERPAEAEAAGILPPLGKIAEPARSDIIPAEPRVPPEGTERPASAISAPPVAEARPSRAEIAPLERIPQTARVVGLSRDGHSVRLEFAPGTEPPIDAVKAQFPNASVFRSRSGVRPDIPILRVELFDAQHRADPTAAKQLEQSLGGGFFEVVPPVPRSFREFVESQGRRWPITVRDPGYAALREEFDALRKPRYEKRGVEVVDTRTGEIAATGRNGAEAQLLANRMNLQQPSAEMQKPLTKMQAEVAREEVPPEAAPPSKPVEVAPAAESLPALVVSGVERFQREGERGSDWAFSQEGTKESRDAVDAYLVKIKHPSAFEAGSQEQRFKRLVRELAKRQPEITQPEVPPEFGSSNVLFTRERKEAAETRLREKGQRLTAGIDPTLLKDLVEVGGFYVEGGLREFAAWSDRMARDLGERVRPHLQQVWDEIQRQRGEGKEKGLVEVGPPTGGPPPETALRAELPPLEEPILRLPRHKEVLDAAEDIFRAAGVTRDKDRWPILSDQLLDMLREGTLQLPEMQRALEGRNLTLTEFGEQLFRPAVKNAAQRLQMLSALQRRLNQMAAEAGTKEQAQVLTGLAERAGLLGRETDEALKALSWWRRADNVRRGLLVTQLATAVRNLETQMGRLGIDVLDRALQRAMGGEADPSAPLKALQDTMSQLRPTPTGGAARKVSQAKVDALLEAFPREWDRLFGSYSSDIAKQARESGQPLQGADRVFVPAERMVNLLNFFNRFQEFATRRGVFWAELSSKLDKRGIEAEALARGERRLAPEEWDAIEPDVKASVQKALEMTFAQQPPYGSVGWHFVKMVNQLPIILSGPIPFPRFMAQSLRFLYEFSPLPILTGRAFTQAELGKWRAGDRQTMSRATLGTAMFLAAWVARESQPDENRWNEVSAPGMGTVDIRPFNPFAAYFFVGELAKRARQGTLYKIDSADIIRGIASANVRGGLGLFALDKAVQGLGDLAKTGKLKEALQSAGGELLSGLLVPLRTLTDLYAQFDPEAQISRERREEPLLGPAKAQIPPAALRAVGAEVPEPVYSPTRAEPLKREQPALRQATGLTVVSEKNPLERELDRFQFDRREILGPSTGDPRADNLLAKHMGSLAEERLVPYVATGDYQRLSDAEKMNVLRKRLSAIRAIARGRARREEPEVFKEIKEERRPARERLLREERRERGLAPAGATR